MFWSPSIAGFSSTDPGDGYEITAERHAELRVGQEQGKTISSQKDGKPYLKSPPEPTPEELLEIAKANRQNAYRMESDPLYMEWQYDKTEESEAAWREKVADIKGRFPLPAVS